MTDKTVPDPDFEHLIHFIQESRGLDFRGYKRSSLRRRVLRRMEQTGCPDFTAYHAFLEAHPQEFTDLLNTVLINVTAFFRDPEAWDVLRREVLPGLLARKAPGQPIRVWSVGCASGEEPYSLAMLFAEAMGVEDFCRRVKIYATDLDEVALQEARHAAYGARAVENVPKDLLERYFEHTNSHYMVRRDVRKSVIFGRHNVVSDAPISRIDLLVCRNLLIYLETDTQKIVLPRLHYALVNNGILFLGKSETQLGRSKLFEAVDLKHRIFRKVPQEWRRSLGGSVTLASEADAPPSRPNPHMRLLEAIVGSSNTAYVALAPDRRVIFANGCARRLLEIGEQDIGRPFQDLPLSYRPVELRTPIEKVEQTGRPVRLDHQEFLRPPAEPIRLTIVITPLFGPDGAPIATLLEFSDTTRSFVLQQALDAAQESLETTVEELQSTNEELETTNEELQSTNEELETTNEELQSTNEELETMNEELQSTNEELEAANEELRRHGEATAEYQRYSEAVLRSIDAGIIVLDPTFTVRSWNRWCENVWGLRSEEVLGTALFDLDIGLPVARLSDAIRQVAQADAAQSEVVLEGIDRRGRPIHCRARLSSLLYEPKARRGVVIILEDITHTVRSEAFGQYLGRIIGQSANEVYFLDPKSFRFQLVNRGAEQKLGYSLDQLRQLSLADLMPTVKTEDLRDLVEPLLSGKRKDTVFETEMQERGGKRHPVEICLQHFGEEQPPILVAIVHDISERQKLGAAD